MAIWQFDLFFIPTEASPLALEHGARAVRLLPESSVVTAHALLSESLGPPWQMCEGILVFGSEDGNRIEIALDNDGDAELSARIDARLESSGFCSLLSNLASRLECRLFSPELATAIDPLSEQLVAALMRSQAWAYALDPAEAIRRIQRDAP